MRVVCTCGKEFTPSKLNEKYLGAMITKVFFTCPYCNKERLVMVKTSKARQLMYRLKELNKLNTKSSMTMAESVKKELKTELDKYNRIYFR